MPPRIFFKERFGNDQAQHRVAQELEALVVAGGLRAPLLFRGCTGLRTFIGQRPVGQRAHQQFAFRKAVPENGLEFAEFIFRLGHRSNSVCHNSNVVTMPKRKISLRDCSLLLNETFACNSFCANRRPIGRGYCGLAVEGDPAVPVAGAVAPGLAVPAPEVSSSASSSQLWPLTA